MKIYKSDKVRFISGLIFIIIIYTWYYIYIAENRAITYIPKRLIHLIGLITTFAIYFIGTFHLGKLKDKWLSSLWHLIHISGLAIIVVIGLYHWLISEITLDTKHFARGVQEILISPVLYVAMGLINKSLNKKANT